MVKDINRYTDGFVLKYEQFVNSCDGIEAEGLWNIEEYGQMEGYYFNILLGTVLYLIVVDGEIEEKEVEYVNRNFGFTYSLGELKDLYAAVGNDIEKNYLKNAKFGFSLLEKIGEEIAQEFLELMGLICNIIAYSDKEVEVSELEVLKNLNREI